MCDSRWVSLLGSMKVQANKSSSGSLLHSAAFSGFGIVVVLAVSVCLRLRFCRWAEADEALKNACSDSYPIRNVERIILLTLS